MNGRKIGWMEGLAALLLASSAATGWLWTVGASHGFECRALLEGAAGLLVLAVFVVGWRGTRDREASDARPRQHQEAEWDR